MIKQKVDKVNYMHTIESQTLHRSINRKSNFAKVEEQNLILHKTSQEYVREGQKCLPWLSGSCLMLSKPHWL